MTIQNTPGLLATDLDGTLAVGGIISREDRQAAAMLRDYGIPVLVITGRNPKSLKKVDGLWDVADEVLFSSGAGLLESELAEPVEKARLTSEEVAEITSILIAAGEDFCVLDPVPNNHRFSWRRRHPLQENPDFDSRMDIYIEWGRPSDNTPAPASQVLVIMPPGLPLDPELGQKLSRWSVFHSSSPIDHKSTWLEIFPRGLNKGRALAAWCRGKNLDRKRVLALGNDFNDETMLSWAGWGRVVEGAPMALKNRFAVVPPAGAGGFKAAAGEALERFSAADR